MPSSGTASDVGGMISASSRKNTVSDTRIEMQSVTWNGGLIVAIRINDSLIAFDGYCVMLANKMAIMSESLRGDESLKRNYLFAGV